MVRAVRERLTLSICETGLYCAADTTRHNVEGDNMVEFSGFLGLLLLVLVIYAIVKTVQSGASTGSKVLWIIILLLIPFIGFILWLLLGPKGGANTI